MAIELTVAPPVTICVLTFGDHLELAQRSIGSIVEHCERSSYRLVVGANAVCAETATYLRELVQAGSIDRLVSSETNINKCPMMRRMFEGVETEFVWWFDDDSYIQGPTALDRFLVAARGAPQRVVMWGEARLLECEPDFELGAGFSGRFVRTASWYRGLTPPSWQLGGKGELDFRGEGSGDGRWFFIVGGCWWIRTAAVRELDWPDPRLPKGYDDVYLGEAIRQRGWSIFHLEVPVAINQSERRGCQGLPDPGSVDSARD